MAIDTNLIYTPGATTTGTTTSTSSDVKGKSSLDMNDFLTLMVEQMKNQDINSTTDTSEYINQLSQYTMIQAVTEMAKAVQDGFSSLNQMTLSTYSMSMIGKDAVIAYTDLNGDVQSLQGKIEGVTLFNDEPMILVGGKEYPLSSVMSLGDSSSSVATDLANSIKDLADSVLKNEDEENESTTIEEKNTEATQNANTQAASSDAQILAMQQAAAQVLAENE